MGVTTTGCATGTGGGGLPVNNPVFTGALSGPVMDVQATSNNIVYADQFAGRRGTSRWLRRLRKPVR